jgi:hypothetical protein
MDIKHVVHDVTYNAAPVLERHAMKRSGGTAPTFLTALQDGCGRSVSHSGPSNHWRGSLVGLTTDGHAVVTRKIPALVGNQAPVALPVTTQSPGLTYLPTSVNCHGF